MKIFKLVLVVSLSVSGYLGYTNYQTLEMKAMEVKKKLSIERAQPSIEGAEEAVRERARPTPEKESDIDYEDLIMMIIKSSIPLLAPILAAKRKKQPDGTVRTLDDSVGNIAENMGVSRAFVRGRLGLGDRRKKQTGTKKKRRATD